MLVCVYTCQYRIVGNHITRLKCIMFNPDNTTNLLKVSDSLVPHILLTPGTNLNTFNKGRANYCQLFFLSYECRFNYLK